MEIEKIAKAPALCAFLEQMENRERTGTDEEEKDLDFAVGILNRVIGQASEEQLSRTENIAEKFFMAIIEANNEKAKTEKE